MKYEFELKLFIIGLGIFSFAVGKMSSADNGFLMFGGGLLLLAIGSALIKYLNVPKEEN